METNYNSENGMDVKELLYGDWNAVQFFEDAMQCNLLAVKNGFIFCKVSGLEGFEEALHAMQQATAFCCVSDIADGYTELNNTPRTRRIKTVFLAMRHAIDDMDARQECMETMRELFRQMMSVVNLERFKLEQNYIYLDPRISFNEIDRYFFSGCACAYFQIAVDVFTDLVADAGEWNEEFAENYGIVDRPRRWDVWILSTNQKIALIKYFREVFDLGLSDAKALVDTLPMIYKENVTKTEAEEIKKAIEDSVSETVVKIVGHGRNPYQ